ncbi:hypothetical protein HK100_003275 [Physocladia obscura]|uniref:Uncharacterized protein n=1 Tax=Physocladia obscura TaxID=109957 RepID=A0AAD5XEQ5_9FUNG|nr:hypothetical protein HK100_003275 [Physocladia obscura]
MVSYFALAAWDRWHIDCAQILRTSDGLASHFGTVNISNDWIGGGLDNVASPHVNLNNVNATNNNTTAVNAANICKVGSLAMHAAGWDSDYGVASDGLDLHWLWKIREETQWLLTKPLLFPAVEIFKAEGLNYSWIICPQSKL